MAETQKSTVTPQNVKYLENYDVRIGDLNGTGLRADMKVRFSKVGWLFMVSALPRTSKRYALGGEFENTRPHGLRATEAAGGGMSGLLERPDADAESYAQEDAAFRAKAEAKNALEKARSAIMDQAKVVCAAQAEIGRIQASRPCANVTERVRTW